MFGLGKMHTVNALEACTARLLCSKITTWADTENSTTLTNATKPYVLSAAITQNTHGTKHIM